MLPVPVCTLPPADVIAECGLLDTGNGNTLEIEGRIDIPTALSRWVLQVPGSPGAGSEGEPALALGRAVPFNWFET
jgi:hypothetical protein